MNLLHLVFRQWRQRPARFAFTVLSLAVAVASVLGTMLSQQSVRSGYRQLSETLEGKPAVDVVAKEGGRFDAAEAPAVEKLAGIHATAPMMSRASMARVKGERFATVLLGLPFENRAAWAMLDMTAGRPPRKSTEAVLGAELAASRDVQLGDQVTLLARRGPKRMTVVGLAKGGSMNALSPGATLMLPLAALQQYSALVGQVDRLRIYFEDAEARDAAEAVLEETLPKTLVLQRPTGEIVLAESLVHSSELALQFAGALSVMMAAFIVLNSLRMNFGERRRELAALRTLGATTRQLVQLHLVEGALIGLAGACLGIPAGIALGRTLSAAMGQIMGSPIDSPGLPATTLLIALATGPLVAALAAMAPAIQSRSISPREAMEGAEARPPDRLRWRGALAGLMCFAAAAVLMALVISERAAAELAIPAGILMLLGFLAVLPALLAPLVRIGSMATAPAFGFEGELAAGQLLRRRVRTGLTVGVMVVAVSNGLGLGNGVINNVNDVRSWFDRSMAGDAFLIDPNAMAGTSGDAVNEELMRQPAVGTITQVHYLPTQINGAPAICLARDFHVDAPLPWSLTAGAAEVVRAALARGEMVLSQTLAAKAGVQAGDHVRAELRGRTLRYRVAATVSDYNLGGMAAFLAQSAIDGEVSLGAPDLRIVGAATGFSAAVLSEQLEGVAAGHRLIVRSFAELRRELDRVINGIVGALWGVLTTGFIVAAIAVANTLTMSIWEQTRELGLLRVVGLTPRQLQRLVAGEAVLMGIAAALGGGFAGIVTAWIIHLCMKPLLGYSIPFSLSGALLAANLLGCVIVAWLAAWRPARRAARLNLLQAIAYE